MLIPIRSAFIYLILVSCCFPHSNQKDSCGKLIYKQRFQNSAVEGYIKDQLFADKNILYSGSYVIQEARRVAYHVDPYKRETIDTSVSHYIFFDLKKKTIDEYRSFSDTAKVLKTYPLIDSVLIENGWNFYRYTNLIYRVNMQMLSDTVIDGIRYQRITSNKFAKDSQQHIRTGFIRSDIKNSLFHFDRALDDSLNSTMVRIDYHLLPQNIGISSRIDFVRDWLTKEELKVFKTWKKNSNRGQ